MASVTIPNQNPATTSISAVWANDGGDKVTQVELRSRGGLRSVFSKVWDGQRIHLFGAKNEVVAFNLILEAATSSADGVTVQFNQLAGPSGSLIRSVPASTPDGVFDWTHRDIELFHVRYLQIKGMSRMGWDNYDERQIPQRFRRPQDSNGNFYGGWTDRPDHDKFYPDIAVPMELVPKFSVAAGRNQSVWVDVYIPKSVPTGLFTGQIIVAERGVEKYRVPVELMVRNFTLPDVPSSKTMLYSAYDSDISKRYTGVAFPNPGTAEDLLTKKVVNRQYMVAHRHKISVIGDGGAGSWTQDSPRPEWVPVLNGSLFTAANGYKGPGVATGNGVYSVHTYGSWQAAWGAPSQSSMWTHTNGWEAWFQQHSPATERFLYLIDESTNYSQTETWASWMKSNPGIGRNLKSFATINLLKAQQYVSSLDIAASSISVADTASWQGAVDSFHAAGKKYYDYNSKRPASGSFETEDDGTALRELPWGQYKKGIDRWFFWEAQYYNDYQGGRGETNVFQVAQTFGGKPTSDSSLGMSGWNYGNGDGLLFYPGTDKVNTAESLGLEGPISSLRLKHWRRGIQDIDYVAQANAIDPTGTQAIVNRMVPKVMWENGVGDPKDPTWKKCPISWSSNPDDWEAARQELAHIIDGQ